MAGLAAGIASSFGMATEGAVGVYTAPDHFYEYLPGENINYTRKRIDSKALRAGRRVLARWAPGVADAGGDITMELPNRGLAFLLKHALGTVVSSTTVVRVVNDGVTNGTTTLTSATAAFVAGDVGAVVFSSTAAQLAPGTPHVSVTNGTTVVLSQAAIGTAAGVNVQLGIGHTVTPGDLSGLTFSSQVVRPSVDGTKRLFSYLGCKIDKWTIAAKVNEYATYKQTLYSMFEDTSQSLASPSYGAGYNPYVFTGGQLLIGGVAVDIMEFALNVDNKIAKGRHFMRGTTPERPKEAIENGIRPVSGSYKADFTDLTLYNNYVNGVESSLKLVFQTAATSSLIVTLNVRHDGNTPNVATEGILPITLPFTGLSATNDATALTAIVGTTEATP